MFSFKGFLSEKVGSKEVLETKDFEKLKEWKRERIRERKKGKEKKKVSILPYNLMRVPFYFSCWWLSYHVFF